MNAAANRNRFYEKTLPEGYREALVVDAGSGTLSSALKAVTLLADAVLFALIWFLYARGRTAGIAAGFSVVKCVGFFAAYFIYVALHELTHGLVYKLLTKQKLTFGFKPPVAYCGVQGIYAYRITALLSLLSPLTVFSVVFAVLFFVVKDTFVKLLILVLFALHLSGCAGDLYNVGLFLFRFRRADTLRADTGPKQIYYTKDRGDRRDA